MSAPQRARSRPVRRILTVDYEDWFHVLHEDWTDPRIWEALPSRVEHDTADLLDLLDRHHARATFFLVGWLARRTPDTVREIVRRGHSVASHGHLHRPPRSLDENGFRDDVERSIDAIGEACGVRPRGYRAPGFAVGGCRFPWRDILVASGFRYDASVFPGLYPGHRPFRCRLDPHRPDAAHPDFWEIPVSAACVLGVPLAFSGGGFLRMLPVRLVLAGDRHLARHGRPIVYYLHPRDLAPDSPRVPAPPWRRIRWYGGRGGMRRKLHAILRDGGSISVETWLDGMDGCHGSGAAPAARAESPPAARPASTREALR